MSEAPGPGAVETSAGGAPPPQAGLGEGLGGPPAGRERRLRAVLTHWATGWVVAALMTGAVAGLAVSVATSSPGVPVRIVQGVVTPPNGLNFPVPQTFVRPMINPGYLGGFGAVGTIQSVGKGSFTMTTLSGSKVTVNESSSTVFRAFGGMTTKHAVTKGERVFVVGPRTAAGKIRADDVFVISGRIIQPLAVPGL
jgi:hypothetical protein